MKQLILWLIAVLGACCLGYDNNGGQTGDQASNDDGDESGDPTPAAVVVITDKDVELSASQTKTFSWTSPTGPGTLTARVTWSTSNAACTSTRPSPAAPRDGTRAPAPPS